MDAYKELYALVQSQEVITHYKEGGEALYRYLIDRDDLLYAMQQWEHKIKIGD